MLFENKTVFNWEEDFGNERLSLAVLKKLRQTEFDPEKNR